MLETMPIHLSIDRADVEWSWPIGAGGHNKVYEVNWLGCAFAVKSDVEAWELCFKIALGLNFLHSENVVHRDMQAANIHESVTSTGDSQDKERGAQRRSAEVYSCAMTCYAILMGNVPHEQLIERYVVEKHRPKLLDGLDADLAELIFKCWHDDPERTWVAYCASAALRNWATYTAHAECFTLFLNSAFFNASVNMNQRVKIHTVL